MCASRPNILWVSFEDTNPFYGCYGDPVAKTPNLDRLAADGCRYTHAFSTAGVCAPARSAVITGMYPVSIGTMHMRTTHQNRATPEMPTPYSACPPHYVKCFSEYLRKAGYYCTNNVKTDYQFDPPFTAWDELSDSAHWRNRPDPEQPFFAVFNPTNTHESAEWEEKTPELTVDPNAIVLPPYFPDTPAVRLAMAKMYTQIEASDKTLGSYLDQLKEDGLLENTIIFHWSDHGPLPRGKRWLYDSGIRVPMIVRGPGIKPGTVADRLVSTLDLAPTVLSLCGLDIPCHLQGQPFLGPAAEAEREYVFAARDRFDESYDMVRAARDRRFKYIRNCRTELPYLLWIPYRNRHPIVQEWWRLYTEGKLTHPQDIMFRDRAVEELYDCDADPWELINVAKDPAYADELRRLRLATDGWLTAVGDMGEIDEAEMVRRWYPNGERPRTAAPIIVPIGGGLPGTSPSEGGALAGPVCLQLHTPTQGASMGYSLDGGVRWHLYSRPIPLPSGETTITVKAVRIGYRESEERVATFTVC